MIIHHAFKKETIHIPGDPDPTESNLLILFCVAVLTVLFIICTCTLYCCIRKYFCFKPVKKISSPFGALSKKAFQPVIKSLVKSPTNDQNVIEQTVKPLSESRKLVENTGVSRTRRMKPRHRGPSFYKTRKNSSYNLQVPLDKGSITAEMFTPNSRANLKKEIVLYKAPSFNE